jgi:hypothetical protein
MAALFARVYPKVLLPIVLFQTIASIVKLTDTGVTYGRYFAILFGVFGTIMAIVYGFLSREKTGWIAPIFVVFGLISITPPIDAFSVSFYSQKASLETLLEENNMFENGEVLPNPDISEADKEAITNYVDQFEQLNQLEKINYLPEQINNNETFRDVFGFERTYDDGGDDRLQTSVYLNLSDREMIPISGYDQLIMNHVEANSSMRSIPFDIDNQRYQLIQVMESTSFTFTVTDENDQVLVSFNGDDLISDLEEHQNHRDISLSEATYTAETDQAKITLIIQNFDHYSDGYYGSFYTLIDVKTEEEGV